MNTGLLIDTIKKLGATRWQYFSPRLLVPERRIRAYCVENKCGAYNTHLMCPPKTGTLSDIRKTFNRYEKGILIQYAEAMDVQHDQEGLERTKLKLHHIILETERSLKKGSGVTDTLGLIGGNCSLCDACAGLSDAACLFPDQARPSPEALAVDVVALLRKLNLDSEFHSDKITWTGMVLFNEP